jgi:hypothetical protein
MTATVTRKHGLYIVSFSDQPIEIHFSNFRESSEALTADVSVRSGLTLYPGLLHDKRFNLMASSTQHQWAKYLDSKTPAAKVPWDSLLEEACWVVRRDYNDGDPGVRLRDIPQPDGGSWLVPGLLLARMPNIWFGMGGDGKSLLAMAAALAIQYGRSDLFGGHPILERRRPLWLDWEFDGWENAQRARAMLGDEPEIAYARCYGHLEKQIDRVEKLVNQFEAEFLIIDSAAFAAGGKPEESESVNALFNALRRLDLGCLILAHETKESDHVMPYGSSFWWNGARNIWYLAKEQTQQQHGPVHLDIGMFQRKTNKGRLWPDEAFSIDIEADADDEMLECRVRQAEVRDIGGLAERASLTARVQHALRRQPRTNRELAEWLGEKEDSIRKATARLARAERIVAIGTVGNEKRWGAAAGTSPGQARDNDEFVPETDEQQALEF